MRSKKNKKNKIGSYLMKELLIIITGVIFSFITINYMNTKINKIFVPMTESKLKRILTEIINDSTNKIEFDNNLLTITKNNQNEIKMVNYDPIKIRKIITTLTKSINDNINTYDKNFARKKGFIEEIPLGTVFENNLLNNLGPKIKIKTQMIGNVISNIETEVKPYGINNAYIETRIIIEINAKIYLPFTSKNIKIINRIPLAMNIIEGNIPEGYITSYK